MLIITVGGAVLLLETDRRLIAKSVPRLTLVPMLAVWLITVNPQILTVVATVRLGGALNYRYVAMIKNGGQLLDMALPMSLVMPGFTGCWWMPETAFPVPRIWRRGAIPGKHSLGQSDPPVDVDMQQ